MMRLNIFLNGSDKGGQVIAVGQTLSDVLEAASQKLNVTAKILYTAKGGQVDDVNLLRDDEVIYVSQGEDFIKPANTKDQTYLSQPRENDVGWITLNVGGKLFTTTRNTLTTKESDSMLSRMFSRDRAQPWNSTLDKNGAFLIDRSPVYFEPILNYLRHGRLVIDKSISPQGVLEEAKFFGITSVIDQLESLIEKDIPAKDHTPITRREFVLSLIATPAKSELRCQGMNFDGADLSKLDLRNINFKYASLRNANVAGANLSYCNFERADLANVNMEGATLLTVKLVCAHLEGANMTNCNFDDPAGSRTNMEGANMKNVNLEGSHMAGVNLRVTTLRNSNLQNCDLRGAVLAGADLENCDLSGCDLQEANLRGANLKGATLELMLTPLHIITSLLSKDFTIKSPTALAL